MRIKLTFLTILMLVIFTANASNFFDNGKTVWKIVLSPKSSSVERYAANELKTILKKISNTDFPIVTHSNSKQNLIFIGTPESSPFIHNKTHIMKLNIGGEQRYAAQLIAGNLYLAGRSNYGIMLAVYSFLREILGCRWFWADADGEYLPKLNNFKLPKVCLQGEPDISYRGFHFMHGNDDRQERWLGRNFGNMIRHGYSGGRKATKLRKSRGFYIYSSGHNVVLNDSILLKKHPEWFALYNGKRTIKQLCWSNPEVDKIIFDKISKRLDKYPEISILGLYPADNQFYCRCEKCRKMDISTAWFTFLNRMRVQLKKKYPTLQFASIAYQGYKPVPKCNLDDYKFIEYAMYDRCYVHNLDSSCSHNKKAEGNLKAWRHKTPMGIYAYEFDIFKPSVMVPFYSMLVDQFRFFKNKKIQIVLSETCNPDYPSNKPREKRQAHQMRLAMYLYCQSLWNPNQGLGKLLADWCNYIHPSASREMLAYHMLLDKAWSKQQQHFSVYYNDPLPVAEIFTPSLTKKLLELLDQAEKKTRNTPASPTRDRELKALKFEKALLTQHLINRFRSESLVLNIPRSQRISWSISNNFNVEISRLQNKALLCTVKTTNGNVVKITLSFPDCRQIKRSMEIKNGIAQIKLPVNFSKATVSRLTISVAEKHKNEQGFSAILAFSNAQSINRSILLFIPNEQCAKRNAPKVRKMLLDDNWQVNFANKPSSVNFNNYDIVVLWLPVANNTNKKIYAELLNYVKNGGVAVLSARSPIQFDKLFGNKKFCLNWTGEQRYYWKKRMTQKITPGAWESFPKNLNKHLKKLCTPISGYEIPEFSEWKSMATMRKKNEKPAPYILKMHYGKGVIWLTTGSLGMDDDEAWMTFGSAHIDSVIAFLDNILEDSKTQRR
jgi:hypothetical protein